jgi:hypothetical protein
LPQQFLLNISLLQAEEAELAAVGVQVASLMDR